MFISDNKTIIKMTGSTIAALQSDGTIKSISVHNLGSLSGVGRILVEYYHNNEIINELIGLGNLSLLSSKLSPDNSRLHSFNSPQPGITIAYHRDRGEALYIETIKDFSAYQAKIKKRHIAFNYLWDGTKWYVSRKGSCAYILNQKFIDKHNPEILK